MSKPAAGQSPHLSSSVASPIVRPVAQEARWTAMTFERQEDVAKFAERARLALATTEFQHDALWLAASCEQRASVVAAAGERGASLTGLLLARVGPTPFAYAIRGRVLLRRTLRQYTVHQGPVFGEGEPAEIEGAFAALAQTMESGSAVYLSAVPVSSALYAALAGRHAALHRRFHVVPWGGPAPHFRVEWQGSVARYLESLSAKRRANVRRAAERPDPRVTLTLRKFASAGDIDRFVSDAGAVAEKSHGHSILADAANPARDALIRFAAARGAFVGYVLYAGETPVAYRYGFLYGRTLFAISTGFDLRWSEHKPGAVIFFRMLQDLEAAKTPIDLIDLLPHETAFKRERANLVEATQNFYLFKRSWRGFAAAAPVRLLERGKELAGLAVRYRPWSQQRGD